MFAAYQRRVDSGVDGGKEKVNDTQEAQEAQPAKPAKLEDRMLS